MEEVDKEISEMKLSLNARARIVAESYLSQERERRLKLLREKAGAKQRQLAQNGSKEIAAETMTNDQVMAIQNGSEGHINFWRDMEKEFATNKEYEAEKRTKEQKMERQLAMHFDEVLKDPKPWYLSTRNHEEKYSIDGTIKKKKNIGTKSIDDPLLVIEKGLDKKLKKKSDIITNPKPKDERERNLSSNASSTIDELRAQRIAREREERIRTLKLLNPHMETSRPKSRYNSQFNPEATEAAHNIFRRRSRGYDGSDYSRSRRHKPY
ncbi:9707_t:CDS:2 [Acaulospora colombiana]|uniref:9707_t:CDS:1 n=1 Tax=Acaulospora colombiana TaxID=27376 RepID=A0ACA9L0G3_9GLOM|nr:9707_t:CDS:2 [Acaulospora colombiana]